MTPAHEIVPQTEKTYHIINFCDWRRAKGGSFPNVEPDTREAAVATLDALRAELEAKSVQVKEGSWGYRFLVVDDPDGNQLFFNYPADTAPGKVPGDEK